MTFCPLLAVSSDFGARRRCGFGSSVLQAGRKRSRKAKKRPERNFNMVASVYKERGEDDDR
jgi:hypothetical protein